MKKIICSAIYVDDGESHVHQPKNINSGFVVCGRRHHNCFATISLIYKDLSLFSDYKKEGKIKIIQGFLTNDDKFLNREDSFDVAKKANQIKLINGKLIGSVLTSEDLW